MCAPNVELCAHGAKFVPPVRACSHARARATGAAVQSRARFRRVPRTHRPEQPALRSRPRRRYPPFPCSHTLHAHTKPPGQLALPRRAACLLPEDPATSRPPPKEPAPWRRLFGALGRAAVGLKPTRSAAVSSRRPAQVSTRSTSSSGRARASARRSRSAAAPHQAGWCGTTSTRVRMEYSEDPLSVHGVPAVSAESTPCEYSARAADASQTGLRNAAARVFRRELFCT